MALIKTKQKMILLLLMILNWNHARSASYYPGFVPPMYTQYTLPLFPPHPYQMYPPHQMSPYQMYPYQLPPQSQMMNPQGIVAAPGADAIAAALNLPSQLGSTPLDYNIAGQLGALGGAIQPPIISHKSNIPVNLLSVNVPKPKSSQIGSNFPSIPASNESQKTAPVPIIY